MLTSHRMRSCLNCAWLDGPTAPPSQDMSYGGMSVSAWCQPLFRSHSWSRYWLFCNGKHWIKREDYTDSLPMYGHHEDYNVARIH
jgi:hypothetical protein